VRSIARTHSSDQVCAIVPRAKFPSRVLTRRFRFLFYNFPGSDGARFRMVRTGVCRRCGHMGRHYLGASAFLVPRWPHHPESVSYTHLDVYKRQALGHETRTRWVLLDGIPAVEAEWWAGGLLVTESLFALQDSGVFVRRITLSSRNLGGPEAVNLRLSLPSSACSVRDGWLMQDNAHARLALACADSAPSNFHPPQADLEIGPLAIAVGGSITVDTFLTVGILPDAPSPEPPRNLSQDVYKRQVPRMSCL